VKLGTNLSGFLEKQLSKERLKSATNCSSSTGSAFPAFLSSFLGFALGLEGEIFCLLGAIWIVRAGKIDL